MIEEDLLVLFTAATVCDENGYEILGEQIRYAAETEQEKLRND